MVSNIIESNGGWGNGVSFYDFDKDGWDDLTIALENDTIAFYKNNFGSFQRIPSFIPTDGRVKQVLWVDYDNDGRLDLFVTQYGAPYKLFKNDGQYNFTDVSAQSGLPQVNLNTWGAAFGDYNKDGFLDLYIAMYETGAQSPENPLRTNQLFMNNGDGTFTNVTNQAGVSNGLQLSFLGAWIDYNRDGWPDLYVINDRTPFNNSLYRNNGDGTFTDVATDIGADMVGEDPMTISVADFDNDGDYDIFMTNSGGSTEPSKLLVNNANQTFTESSVEYGVNFFLNSWGALWLDYNNNSYRDLFVSIDEQFFQQPQMQNLFFINNNGQNFILSDNLIPENDRAKGYGVAQGDINNDGYYDFINHNRGVAPFLYQNSGGENNFIKITLQGVYSNSMGIGAEIEVYCESNKYIHYVMNSENYLGQNSQHIIFGLKDYQIVDSVKIKYLSGYEDTYYNLNVNTSYTFTEGETYKIDILADSENLNNCLGDTIILTAELGFNNYEWSIDQSDSTSIAVFSSGAYHVSAEKDGYIYYSDTVDVNFISTPNISIDAIYPSCFNSNDGFINVDVETDADIFTIEWWSQGFLLESMENLEEGVYTYFYEDNYACSDINSVILTSPLELNIQYQFLDSTENALVLHYLINGGTPPYNVFLNNLLVIESELVLEKNQKHILEVVDNNSCIDSLVFDLRDENLLTHTEFLNESLNSILYPNPCQNILNLKTDRAIENWSIYSLEGRKVIVLQEKKADVSFLTTGMYIANIIYSNGEKSIFKFIKE